MLKTSLGSEESVNWEYKEDPVGIVMKLKNKGYTICSLEQTNSNIPYTEIRKKDFPLCLIIGNEISGVGQDLMPGARPSSAQRRSSLPLSDVSIEIPQYGIKQSLNVAVAYGIAIFELRRIFNSK